jgi:hypothetical protein
MEKMRNAYRSLVLNLKGRNHLGNLSVDGNIVKWILEKCCKLDLNDLG